MALLTAEAAFIKQQRAARIAEEERVAAEQEAARVAEATRVAAELEAARAADERRQSKLILRVSAHVPLQLRTVVERALKSERLLVVDADDNTDRTNPFDAHVVVRIHSEVFNDNWAPLAKADERAHTIVVLSESADPHAYHSWTEHTKAVVEQCKWLSLFVLADDVGNVVDRVNELPDAVRAFQTN